MSAQHFRDTGPAKARVLFLTFGVMYLAIGLAAGLRGALFVWLGSGLLLLGVSYATHSAKFIGKRGTGAFVPLAYLVNGPFLLTAWIAWQLRRRRNEPAWNEVAPGIYVGRLAPHGPPGAQWVADLTCELGAPQSLRGPNYRCVPTLDGCAPEEKGFAALLAELTPVQGPIYVCCAAGHGRSATLAAALIIKRGLAVDVIAAERMMQKHRPLIGLGASQRALVERTAGAVPVTASASTR